MEWLIYMGAVMAITFFAERVIRDMDHPDYPVGPDWPTNTSP